jgi:hypothetical protein
MDYYYTGHNGSNLYKDVQVDLSAFMPWTSGGSAKAIGMGGAYTAVAEDLGTIEYNPAGLGLVEHMDITALGVAVRSDEINPTTGNKDSRWNVTPTFGAAGFKVGPVAMAVSARKPYFPVFYQKYGVLHQDITAPDGWRMRYDTYSDKVDSSGLKTYSVTSALAMGPVSIGANYNWINGDVIRTVRGQDSSRLNATSSNQFNSIDRANFQGFTIDVGALYRYKILRLGASAKNLLGKVNVREDYLWRDNYDMVSGNWFVYDPRDVKKSFAQFAPTYTLAGALVLEKWFAVDFDYSQISLTGQDKAIGRLGAELWVIPHFLAARAGFKTDFKNMTNIGDEKTREYYLGTGVNIWKLEVDASASMSQVKAGEEGNTFTGAASATLRF